MNEATDVTKKGSAPKCKRGRGFLRLLVGTSAVMGIAAGGYWLANREPAPEPVTIVPADMKQVGTISDRFLSYNVEMVEITGGRFWRPYKDGKREGDDRYEYRPPIDLTDPRLVKLAAALGPAYARASGTWANATYFDPDNSLKGEAPEGFHSVLTGEQWQKFIDFTRQTDSRIVTSFATSPGVRDSERRWTPDNAQRLVDFTQEQGAEIAAAEYANEPETVDLTQAPDDYTPEEYRRDYGLFYEWMRKASPDTLIMAPGAAELGEPTAFLRKWTSGLTVFDLDDLIAEGEHRPDVISFHYYGGGSQRCGEIPVIGYNRDDALSAKWLGLIGPAIETITALRDRIAPDAPIWLTETGETACGGNPWAATFTDVFRFTDQVARSARQGVKVYMHNTLAASDYALLEEEDHSPRPNYWAAWLWRQLMGTKVLDAGKGTTGLHVYAHCMRNQPGGVSVLAINRDVDEGRELNIPGAANLYSMTGGKTPKEALLNGVPLRLGPDDGLPTLTAKPVQGGAVQMAPASVNFLIFPDANNKNCR